MKAIVVTRANTAHALQRLMPNDVVVRSVGDMLTGRRFDEIVMAEDYSDPCYQSKTWLAARQEWVNVNLMTSLRPGGKYLWVTSPPSTYD